MCAARRAWRLHHFLGLQLRHVRDDRAGPDRPRRGLCGGLGARRARPAVRRFLARPGGGMSADQVRTFTVTDEDDGIRLDRWFRRNLPEASFGTVARWARTGQLRLDGKRAAPATRSFRAEHPVCRRKRGADAGRPKKAPPRPASARTRSNSSAPRHTRTRRRSWSTAAGPRTQGGTKNQRASRSAAGLASSRTARRPQARSPARQG